MTLLDSIKGVALLSAAFMCAAIGGAALDARDLISLTQSDEHALADKAGIELDAINTATRSVSGAAVSTLGDAGGTMRQVKSTVGKLDPSLDQLHTDLEEGYKVEHDARVSLDNVNKAAIDERFYFERDLPPLMDALKVDVVNAGETMTSASTLLSNPDLKRFLADSADMTASGKSILADGAYETHKLTHPDKKRGFIAGFEATGDVAKHWLPSLF